MVGTGFVPLPEGITTMPPGPELGAALATVDPARVAPGDTALLLAATRRQLSATEALHASALRECALADPYRLDGRAEEYGRYAASEPRAVLTESRTRIQATMTLAEDAFVRLPAVGAAWAAGDIDTDRARLFGHWTRALSPEHAAAVVETVLPEARLGPDTGLTLSGLIERIGEVATALDPTWSARTYNQATAQQRVRARRTEAGTVNLSGLDLPLDEGTRSAANVATMAARAKAAGHPGGIDTVRARMYLLMLQPRTAGCDDDALVAYAVATASHAPSETDPHVDPGDPADAPADPESAPQATPDAHGADEPVADEPVADADTGEPGVGGIRLPRQAHVELRVALSTLLGLDLRPARMPGHGVLHAELARELAMSHSRGRWRVAVVDDAGDLTATLTTRRRPREYVAGPPLGPGTPPAIVELHVTEVELSALDPTAHPAWAAVLRDLQLQLGGWRRAQAEDAAARDVEQAGEHAAHATPVPDLAPEVLRRVTERHAARVREAAQRFPTPALRRWVEQRDRVCSFPPCGASATRCDIDHTLAVTVGGITVSGNLGPACGHDHDAKTTGGWTLRQDRPGRFTWASPTGNLYPGRTPKIIPELPDPLPLDRQGRSDPLPDEYADHGPLWHNAPYPPLPADPPPGGPSDEPGGPTDPYPDEPPF